jgi:hypothetical protein
LASVPHKVAAANDISEKGHISIPDRFYLGHPSGSVGRPCCSFGSRPTGGC